MILGADRKVCILCQQRYDKLEENPPCHIADCPWNCKVPPLLPANELCYKVYHRVSNFREGMNGALNDSALKWIFKLLGIPKNEQLDMLDKICAVEMLLRKNSDLLKNKKKTIVSSLPSPSPPPPPTIEHCDDDNEHMVSPNNIEKKLMLRNMYMRDRNGNGSKR